MKLSTSGLKMWSSRSGRIVLTCLLALMLLPFMGAGKVAHATSPTWAAVGQTVQPSNVQTFLKVGGTLYAGTATPGYEDNDVWSNSNGTWTKMNGSPSVVRTLLADANGTLYAGGWGDGNNVWTYTARDGWKQMMGSPGNVYSLIIDVNGAIYAGTSNGSSNDVWTYTAVGGWTKMMGSPGDAQALTYINGTLYAGTGSNGVWANSNGSWTQISSGVSNPKYVASLVNGNGTLYAAGTLSGDNRSVWTYNNSNSTWTLINGAPARAKTLRYANGTLYAGTASGSGSDDVWTYTTGGGWVKMTGAPGSVYALLDDNGTLYAGTQTGRNDVWTNNNGTWTQMGVLPGRTNTLFSANGTLYAGTDNDTNAVWAYTASGGWTQMSGSPGYVYALINVNGKLYAGTSNDDNDNDVWTYDTTAPTPAWTQMTISNAPSNVYTLLNVNGTLYVGSNNGNNDIWTYDTAATSPEWTQMTAGNVPSYVNALVNVNGTLYAGTGGGTNDVWTYDTTATSPAWTQMTASNMPSSVHALINVNGTLYAGTSVGHNDVWTYDTNATTPVWTQMTTSNTPGSVNALINVNGTLYAGIDYNNNDIWSYSNGTWEQVSGSPNQINSLLWANGNLYAGGNNGVEQLIAPGAPVNLQVNSTTSTSTTLSWDTVSGATGYYIYENGGNTAIATVTSATYTVNGLVPNTPYTFAVSAFNAAGESAKSGVITVQTPSTDATLTSTIGTVSTGGTANESITNIPYATTLDELKAAITPAANATYKVYDADGTTEATALATGKKVIVTAQDGITKVTYTVTVNLSTDATLTSTIGTVSTGGTVSESITNIPYGTTLAALKAAITKAANATFEVYDADGTTVATALATGKKVIVTAQDGTTKVTYTVTVNLSTAATLTSTIGTVSTGGTANESITNIPYGTTLAALKAAITPAANATFEVYDADGTTVATALATGKKVIVTAQDGTTKVTYTVAVIPSYTVTYNGNGATSGNVTADSGSYAQGATVSVYGNTGNLLKTGYTFAGWNTQADGNGTTYAAGATFSMGTANVTLYAKWTANPTYTVTYRGNGNSGGSAPTDSGSYAQGVTVSVYGNTGNLVKAGYTFAGWNTQADGNGTTYTAGTTFSMATANVTLYAKWTANPTYTVTYNGNGATSGSVPTDSSSYAQGVTVSVYGNTGNLVKTGYTFAGWNTQADGNGTTYTAGTTFSMGTMNVTQYAKWTANPTANPTYTVTYNGNGATSGSVPADNSSYAQSVTVSVYGNTGNLVKTGYTFSGWNTAVDGSGTTYTAGTTFSMGTTNVTLYAKWTADPMANPTYTVTYNGNGNSGGSAPTDSGSYVQGVTVSVYGNTGNLVKTGYTFAGWDTQADGNGTTYAAGATFSMGATNVTLYAKWTANNTGRSSSGGGSSSSTSTIDIVTSTNGTLTLPVGKTGEVSLGDAVNISIPADASDKELKLTIEIVADAQKLLTKNDVLASPVVEILKNFPENFSKEITLTFTFDLKSMKKGQQPSVFYYDEAKKVWVKVGGTVNGNTITVKVNHFTKYAVLGEGQDSDSTADTKQAVNFNDISVHWAEATIKQAVSAGIVSGYPDGTFKPDHTVTRAEFAVMLMNVLKPQGDGLVLAFTDKAKIGAWAQKSVAQAMYAGIITGYEDSTFRPDAEITRPEMAVMIAKALGQSVENTTATGFADDKDIPAWAKGAVAAMKKLGIIEGKGADEFAPVEKTTRAEAVTVLLKMLAQKGK
ncbi:MULTISPECIES: InlB B-repeat-containing protein [unclassified Paenibacillus]|uniref:InlB B-repeat-containing protein n=1 Tax=unclassified Paenibacillus TaxID=185978 RepID=UPI003640F90E